MASWSFQYNSTFPSTDCRYCIGIYPLAASVMGIGAEVWKKLLLVYHLAITLPGDLGCALYVRKIVSPTLNWLVGFFGWAVAGSIVEAVVAELMMMEAGPYSGVVEGTGNGVAAAA